MKATDETKLKAFLVALDQLDSLPEAAYTAINQVGIAIAQRQSDRALAIMNDLIQTYPNLSERYEAARLNLKRQYQAQERSKSAAATLEKTGIDLEQTAVLLLTGFNSQAATLFPNQTRRDLQTDQWAKSDRIAVMAAGGAFLGGIVAQIPGALIGSCLAALYGWYIGFGKSNITRTP